MRCERWEGENDDQPFLLISLGLLTRFSLRDRHLEAPAWYLQVYQSLPDQQIPLIAGTSSLHFSTSNRFTRRLISPWSHALPTRRSHQCLPQRCKPGSIARKETLRRSSHSNQITLVQFLREIKSSSKCLPYLSTYVLPHSLTPAPYRCPHLFGR